MVVSEKKSAKKATKKTAKKSPQAKRKAAKSGAEKLYSLPRGKVLVLRTCAADNSSHGGFIWPSHGPVKCPDWIDNEECGNGLHGLLWGAGDGSLLSWSEHAKWLVVEVDEKQIVNLDGKVKFPSGFVVYCGYLMTATEMVLRFAPIGTVVVGGTATAGDGGTATAGYRGTATAGDRGIITISYWDEKQLRRRVVIGYVGENGIKANTRYRLNSVFDFEEVK